MDYILTQHAQELLLRRDIPIAWVERTLEDPSKIEPDKIDDALEHRLAGIPEYGHRVLRVIINKRTSPVKIVTFYFDRNMKGKL
jgi:hypothetical protein